MLYYTLLTLFLMICSIKLILQLQTRRLKNLPPGPPPLPIIGNLHHLKSFIHRTLSALSLTYGDIISLYFGSRLVVVVSSSLLAQECFIKNDIVLANRPRLLAGKHVFYNYSTIVSVPYGDLWRNLRRITVSDLLSTQRLNSFMSVRRDEIKRLVQKLGQDSSGGGGYVKVELRSRVTQMMFNVMMRMISGKRYYGEEGEVSNVEQARKFREIMRELLPLLGASNKADFLPLLRLLDFNGLERRLIDIANRCDQFLKDLIQEHHTNHNDNHHTMIHHLLNLQHSQPDYYSDHIIKGLIQAMLIAGTDTSVATIEWAMAELLNHPAVMKKVRDELDTQVGKDRLVDEQDLSKLPYLQNVIHETLRLHPPTPLLLPHCSSQDCTIGGYNIPKDTIFLINVWFIHRDPRHWTDATSFKPERYEKEGEADKLLAFGLGRRACPGSGLAQRTVGSTLALLIQCFEWKRQSEEKLDMTEDKGITMPKRIPLEAMCKPLPIFNKVFQ